VRRYVWLLCLSLQRTAKAAILGGFDLVTLASDSYGSVPWADERFYKNAMKSLMNSRINKGMAWSGTDSLLHGVTIEKPRLSHSSERSRDFVATSSAANSVVVPCRL